MGGGGGGGGGGIHRVKHEERLTSRAKGFLLRFLAIPAFVARSASSRREKEFFRSQAAIRACEKRALFVTFSSLPLFPPPISSQSVRNGTRRIGRRWWPALSSKFF